jgi:arginine decarboxylase-like protein
VILATKLGRTIIPVIENFSELELVLGTRITMAYAPNWACA